MAAMSTPPRLIEAAGIAVELRLGGSDAPLLVIHGELGVPGWLESFAQLADHYNVVVPSLPGYGRSTRPDWIMSVHDLAAWVSWFARDLDLRTPVNVIGCSMGGWVAAEIATVAPRFFNKLVLVGAMGIKPEHNEIFDYFLESGLTGLRRAFDRPEQSSEFMRYWGKEWTPVEADLMERHREMTCRIAWKPYMHALPCVTCCPALPRRRCWCGDTTTRSRRSSAAKSITAPSHARSLPSSSIAVICPKWSSRRNSLGWSTAS
jgi:pimeloyl-ACP methyl ester carboxylesterase